MGHHVQLPVPGHRFDADAGIVDLLAFYNDAGLSTEYSCQGDRTDALVRHGYLYFSSAGTLPAFLRLTDDLVRGTRQWHVLRAMRGLTDPDAPCDQNGDGPSGPDERWRIQVTYNQWRFAREVAHRERTAGRLLTGDELVDAGHAGWIYTVRVPAEHLRLLNDEARRRRS